MKYQILGTTEEKDQCEKCGKKHLQKTVALKMEDGQIVYYGTTCAAKAVGMKSSAMKVEADAVADAEKWLAKGIDRNKIAMAIWNKYGFGTEVKNGKLRIAKFYQEG